MRLARGFLRWLAGCLLMVVATTVILSGSDLGFVAVVRELGID